MDQIIDADGVVVDASLSVMTVRVPALAAVLLPPDVIAQVVFESSDEYRRTLATFTTTAGKVLDEADIKVANTRDRVVCKDASGESSSAVNGWR